MPAFQKDHSYGRVHGHSYELTVYIEGKRDEDYGWIFNYDEIDNLMKPLIKLVDHNLLNEIKGLENPTSENIAIWFWNRLIENIPNLKKIEINRPRIGGCSYSG